MRSFRSDINGLRAIAVAAVVLYHFSVPGFGGGFVGVDIFFVISGFLMTGIIVNGLDAQTFSILKFYLDRAKRIIPALAVACTILLVIGAAVLMPSELATLGKHVASSITFISNVIYWREAGYFDAASHSKWLLHTWSLSVEWQFYLLFPLLMTLLWKWTSRKKALLIVAALTILSFGLSASLTSIHPATAFYLLPTRSWEMLAGGLVFAYPIQLKQSQKITLSVVGLLMLVASVVFADPRVWPGWQAALPVLGCAAVIAANREGSVLFSLKPVQWLGNVSYSVYLWHWPIVVALHYFGELTGIWITVGIVLSLMAGWLSYMMVETPTRKLKVSNAGRYTGYGARLSILCIAFGLIGLVFFGANGFPSRMPGNIQEILASAKPASGMREGECFLTSGFNSFSAFNKDLCLTRNGQKPNMLILGDSHAAHFWSGLSKAFPASHVMQATASGCKPVLGSQGEQRCTQLVSHVLHDFLPSGAKIQTVILSARWMKEDIKALLKTVEHLKQYAEEVVVFGPIREYAQDLPIILARESHFALKNLPMQYAISEREEMDKLMETVLRAAGIKYVSVYHHICPDRLHCTVVDESKNPLQFDYGHLTNGGSQLVAKRIADNWPLQ